MTGTGKPYTGWLGWWAISGTPMGVNCSLSKAKGALRGPGKNAKIAQKCALYWKNALPTFEPPCHRGKSIFLIKMQSYGKIVSLWVRHTFGPLIAIYWPMG